MLFCSPGLGTYAQTDSCLFAPILTVGNSCITTNYDLSSCQTNTGPALYSGTSFRDGWFQFTTGDNATAVKITAQSNTSHNIALSTYLACDDATAQASIVPNNKLAILYAPVNANTTYYLRISRTQNGNTGNLGTICIESIDAVVATYHEGNLNSEYASTEPTASDVASCHGSLTVDIPAGNAITTVSTLYHIRSYHPALMQDQRSILSCPTISTREENIVAGSGSASNTQKYERHNLLFAEGAAGSVEFNLSAWNVNDGDGCSTEQSMITNHTWTVIAYYEHTSNCPAPSFYSFVTTSCTSSEATISFEAPVNAPEGGYEYVVSTTDDTPQTPGSALQNGTEVNLNSLLPGTKYYLFVRSMCSESDYSYWSNPYPFTTKVCEPTSQCLYHFQMNNLYDGGWNGTIIGFRQNGILTYSATLAIGSTAVIDIPLCDNTSTEIFVEHLASYSNEMSFTLFDNEWNEVFVHGNGSMLQENEILGSFTSECPACQTPSGISFSYPSSNSINIHWMPPFNPPSGGYEYAISSSPSTPVGAGISVPSGATTTVSSLSPSESYYVFIRSICSEEEESIWSLAHTFTMPCAETSLPIFEGLNSASPECWNTQLETNVISASNETPQLHYIQTSENPSGFPAWEGSGFFKFNSYDCDIGDQIRLISAPFETDGISEAQVKFVWLFDAEFSNRNDGVQLQYSFDNATWTNIGDYISRYSTTLMGWNPINITLPQEVLNQPHVYIGFLFTGGGGNDCYIDNLIIRETPACAEPSTIQLTHITNTLCTIEWDASSSTPEMGYSWELRTSGNAGSGSSGLIASGITEGLFTQIEDLTPLTAYTFYIKSNCGQESSDWSWPLKIHTVASAVTEIPYIETFEVNSSTRPGWLNEQEHGYLNWIYGSGAGEGGVNTAHDGVLNARFRSSTDIPHKTKLVSPPLDIASLPAGAKLHFWYANEAKLYKQNELRVYYKTTYGNTWTLIPGAVYKVNQATWTEISLTLPGVGSDYYIAFEGLNKESYPIVLDDIRIEPLECPIPSAQVVAGMTSAYLNWEITGDYSSKSFQWEIRTSGEPGSDSSGMKKSGTTNQGALSKNISGLTANTTYYLYVRTLCSEEEYSLWSDGFEFTTTNIAPPTNDQPQSNNPKFNNVSFYYPNCFSKSGTTVGAIPSEATGETDVWYQFTPTSTAVSIHASSNTVDTKIYLFEENDLTTPLDVENMVDGIGTEILNYNGLTPGTLYRIVISTLNGQAGGFDLCIQNLRQPKCVSTQSTWKLCDLYKSVSTGATSTTFHFTDENGITKTASSTGGSIFLNNLLLGLKHNQTYNVTLTANYMLTDGAGNPELIQIIGEDTCVVPIINHQLVEVRENNRCSQTELARNEQLWGSLIGSGSICGIKGYRIEFTQADNCEGVISNPEPLTFSKPTNITQPYINLNYAFGDLANNLPNSGFWSVRWKPRFTDYEGTYGPAQTIKVKNTGNQIQGMAQFSSEPMQGIGSPIATAIYPNPSNGTNLNILISGGNGENCTIKILDSMGKIIQENEHILNEKYSTQLKVTQELSAGVYFVEYVSEEYKKVDKFIVIK